MTEVGIDGTDPAGWDPELDAVVAARDHHTVVYEDENVRVVSVTIQPGETEEPHHHRWPSVFVIDSMVKARDHDGEGNEIPLPIPDEYEAPLIVKLPPQPLHYVRNEDSVTFHGTRVEFKNGFAPKP